MEAAAPLTETTNKDNRRSENREKWCRRQTAYQMMACFIANTTTLGPAMGLGYSAIAIGPLVSPESEIKVSINEESWIASITAIATPIGCILSSFLMHRGRRFSMITTSLTSAIGWLAIYLAQNVSQILVGRAICGIAIGLASVPATVYAAEVAAPKLRGIVVTWTSVAIATGILIVYIFGFIFQENWRLVALLCGAFPVISIILVSTKMPESPAWLRSMGRLTEAEKALRKINGLNTEDALSFVELSVFDGCNEEGSEIKKNLDSRGGPLLTVKNLKPLLIMLGYFFFQQFSGVFVVIYYAVDFTIEAGVKIDGNLAAILIGIARLFGTIAVSYISRKFGRRIPSIVSGTGMTIFMGILSIYLWLSSKGYVVNDNGVIPVIAIIMYILTSTMGFLVLPFAMIGEIYPARVKDVFSGVSTCLAYVFSFFVLKVYPDMIAEFDKHGVFLFYAIFSFLGTIFVSIFLPETKGKTLQEIEELFENKNSGYNDKKENDKCINRTNDIYESNDKPADEIVENEASVL